MLNQHVTEEQIEKALKEAQELYSDPEDILKHIMPKIDGDSIEYLHDDHAGETIAYYINTGDTYNLTVLYDPLDYKFHITSWGDFYENWEIEYQEDTDTIRCGYCGHFQERPADEKNTLWHDIICEACNHYVDGSDPKDD